MTVTNAQFAPMVDLIRFSEDTVDRALRSQIAAFCQELWHDLIRRQVTEPRLIADADDFFPGFLWHFPCHRFAGYFGITDLHFVWVDAAEVDPAKNADIKLKEAQRDEILLRCGIYKNANEPREAMGMDPMTPEELESAKPTPASQPWAGQDLGNSTGKSADNSKRDPAEQVKLPENPIDEPAAAKLEKKKSAKLAPPIDRDRAEIVKQRTAMQKYLAAFLQEQGTKIADQVVKLYTETAKADDERAVQIIAQVQIDWAELVPEMADFLSQTTKSGVAAAAAQVSMTDADATKLAFGKAEVWASDRAAELVGMKWIDGELVTNPNPVWSITQSTRDMIYSDVNKAIDEGWSNDKLREAIEDNAGFSDSRASMVARTETAFADIQGNRDAYEAAQDIGIEIQWQWKTAEDDLVSDECAMNADEIRDIGDEFPSGATEPPQHPRCRCDVLPIVEDQDEAG